MFFASLSQVLTNNFLSQQSWAVRAVPTIFPNKWCVILPCLYLTSEKSAPLTQGYSLEIFRLDYSIYVIYFGSLIPISGININLNHKAFSPAPFMQIRHTAFPLLVLLTNEPQLRLPRSRENNDCKQFLQSVFGRDQMVSPQVNFCRIPYIRLGEKHRIKLVNTWENQITLRITPSSIKSDQMLQQSSCGQGWRIWWGAKVGLGTGGGTNWDNRILASRQVII